MTSPLVFGRYTLDSSHPPEILVIQGCDKSFAAVQE